MYHDKASAAASDKIHHTTPIPSSNTSSGVANFTNPLSSHSSIFLSPSSSDESSFPTSNAVSMPATTASPFSDLTQEHRDLLNRHKRCLLQIQKTFREAETLRQENTNLRVANCDLNNRLNRLSEAYLQSQYASMMMTTSSSESSSSSHDSVPMSSILEKFGGLMSSIRNASAPWEGCESPTSVIESDRAERDVDRVSLPKSISVRSTGFLKPATQDSISGTTTARNGGVNRSRPPRDGQQKVYVRGGNQKDGPIALEVHNQGMVKTELCNKWQETGSCPYGEHCQFAHGFEELRPVLRHPRYKTEVCRMVLAGDHCPYGHRCHFRHALTEQEKLMVPHKTD